MTNDSNTIPAPSTTASTIPACPPTWPIAGTTSAEAALAAFPKAPALPLDLEVLDDDALDVLLDVYPSDCE